MLSVARSPGKGLHHDGCATMALKNAELYLQWAPESLWQGANAWQNQMISRAHQSDIQATPCLVTPISICIVSFGGFI